MAYEVLDTPAQRVMQALAIYPSPVSAAGVDFLLQPVDPTTNAAPILTQLVGRQLVLLQDGQYHLHPVDRDYARSQLAPGHPGDSPATFTLMSLQARAADYYAQIRTPKESWRSLEDVRPQLAEFELRCDTGDYDTAAAVLRDIDSDHLLVWGQYQTLIAMHERIYGRIIDPSLAAEHLGNLANCHFSLGDYPRAIELHTQALAIARDIGDRWSEGAALGSLGNCHASLGDYRSAIDLYTQALAIARDIGDRWSEGAALTSLGNWHCSLGDYRSAIDLYTQALAIARDIGDRRIEGNQLGNLANCRMLQGEYRHAIDLYTQALTTASDIGDRQGESQHLGNMASCHHRLGEYRQAIDLHTQALAIFRDLGDRQGESTALAGLGVHHQSLGEYRQAIDLDTQALAIFGDLGDRPGESTALVNLGNCYMVVGESWQAVDTHTQALTIFRDIGDRDSEGAALASLGVDLESLGEYRQAIDLYTQALAIFRDVGDRYGMANTMAHLGQATLTAGNTRQAVTLLEQAFSIADKSGDIESAAQACLGLSQAYLQLGDPAAARAAASRGQELSYIPVFPTLLIQEGLALLELDAPEASIRPFNQAVTTADALLALTESNVAVLYSRALALSGLAVTTGDSAVALEAYEAFARARVSSSAEGVAADIKHLLKIIVHYDRSNILAEVRSAQDL